jgi:hypothetical protein
MRPTFVVLGLALGIGACARAPRQKSTDFVLDEPRPTRVVVTDDDTLFVLGTPLYDLASRHRTGLWQKRALDDVAWQYRRILGAPPTKAAFVLLDSTGVRREELESWVGTPLGLITPERRMTDSEAPMIDEGGSSNLMVVAAQTWLLGAAQRADSEGVGQRWPIYPSWFVVGVTNLVGAPRFADELLAAARERLSDAMKLDSLLAVRGRERLYAARNSGSVEPKAPVEATHRAGKGRIARGGDVVSPFEAQATSFLEFLRQRDPAFVASLPAALANGRGFPDLLATSTRLPHDVTALEAEWRRWVKNASRRDSRGRGSRADGRTSPSRAWGPTEVPHVPDTAEATELRSSNGVRVMRTSEK